MSLIEANNQPLPYFLVNKEKVTMPLSDQPQVIPREEVVAQIDDLTKVYNFFRLLQQQITATPEILTDFPLATDKSPQLLSDQIPLPSNVIVRVDAVNSKIVDINNKPAGLGLILSAYQLWLYREVFSKATPLLPEVNCILPENYNSAVVLTNQSYPFLSDQERLAEIMSRVTKRPWSVKYPEVNPPNSKEDAAILSFSYLNDNKTFTKRWRQYLNQNPRVFLENPATAVFWDNKALMALPFMNLDLPESLKSSLERLKDVFPLTYLIRSGGSSNRLLMATSFTNQGLKFQEIDKENVPVLGQTYLKPLGQSGGRDISVKKFNDWGSTLDGLSKYASFYPEGFIIQQGIKPEIIDNMQIKDGYFISTYTEKAQFIALERMGTLENTPKIHGGSKTKLVSVCVV